MENQKTYYITTPIYYPSSKLHIGHTYTTVAGDVMARYKRLRGYDVMYLTGTDEHGQKIERKAEQMGKTPIEFVDEIVAGIKELWSKLDISYDDYIRTTEDRHKKVVQKIFQRFLEQGDIYLGEYEGFYCVDCEAFFTDRQLKDGNCPDCGRAVNKIKEKSYFFRMSNYADRLVQYYEAHPEFIEPISRKNEMLQNFIKPGLEDLCISRSTFSWGIPLPNDPEQVMYVWLDALSNYITAIGYEADEESLRHKFANYWPADVHLIGKDIVRFHSIYWPIFLMALDLPLPKKVFAHGFFLVNGDKMSKSKGNVIDPVSLIDRYGLDAYRYFLLREVPFGQDGVFTPEAFVERVNADLANDLGNLLHRTLTMVEKYFDGVIPAYVEGATSYDAELQALVHQVVTRFENAMENLQFSVALSSVWELVRAGNKYIENNAPWNLAKDHANHSVLGSVLYSLLEIVRIVSVCIQPFLVKTPLLIWEQIGIQTEEEKKWESIYQFGGLCSGVRIHKQNPIFPRLDGKVEVEAIVQMMKDTATQHKGIDQAESGAGTKQEVVEVQVQDDFISIDEFMKVELKVGEILEAEPVKGANRLLKLQLDLGTQKRQVVSGIAEFYQPQEIVGTKVIVVTNLKPVKLRGEQSEGMILAAKEGERLVLSTVSADIPNGTRVK